MSNVFIQQLKKVLNYNLAHEISFSPLISKKNKTCFSLFDDYKQKRAGKERIFINNHGTTNVTMLLLYVSSSMK